MKILEVLKAENNSVVKFIAVVHSNEELVAKNNNKYNKLKVSDGREVIIVMDWERLCAISKQGNVLELEGTVNMFNNSVNLKLTKAEVLADSVADIPENADYADTVFLAQRFKVSNNKEEIKKELLLFAETYFDNPIFEEILKLLVTDKILDELDRFPASRKIHHYYEGGLLEHIYEMFQIWVGIRNIPAYRSANDAILVLGIVLHDFAKKYDYDENGEFTDDYILVGHIARGASLAENLIKVAETKLETKVSAIDKKKLLHVILAHHGRLEYGSPVLPATQEAVLLHWIDQLSAKNNTWVTSLPRQRNFALENAIIFKG